MNSTITISALLLTTLALGCEKEHNTQKHDEPKSREKADNKAKKTSPKELLAQNCSTCHESKERKSNKLAPSVSAIRHAYLQKHKTSKAFQDAFVAFTADPKTSKKLLPGAVQAYGEMPSLQFPKEKIRAIAGYIFATEFEDAGFKFRDYSVAQKEIPITELPYKERGFKYALSTKKVLGKNLIGALQSSGTDKALSFCNENATGLTGKMAAQHKVGIKRVSDQPRNPKNQANADELDYIKKAKEILKNGGKPKPMLVEKGDKRIGYYPITTKKMCMQCHGKLNDQIKAPTMARLKTLYPKDKATGYGVNELRGIWVIDMLKDN